MLKAGAAGIALVAAIAIVTLLVLGGDDATLSPQDQLTPTPTPTRAASVPPAPRDPGSAAVRITASRVRVKPHSVRRDHGRLTLDLENAGPVPVHFVLVRGRTPAGPDAIRAASEYEVSLRPGERQTDDAVVRPGLYTLLVRPDEHSPASAASTLDVR